MDDENSINTDTGRTRLEFQKHTRDDADGSVRKKPNQDESQSASASEDRNQDESSVVAISEESHADELGGLAGEGSSSSGSMIWIDQQQYRLPDEICSVAKTDESSIAASSSGCVSPRISVEADSKLKCAGTIDPIQTDNCVQDPINSGKTDCDISSADPIMNMNDELSAIYADDLPRFCPYDSGETGDTTPADDVLLVDFSDCQGCDGSTGHAPTKIGVEKAIEKVLVFALHPAIDGVPALGLLTAEARAQELLETIGMGDMNAADLCVQHVIAGSEATTSKVLIHFFIERIPFIGCPALLVKNTWHEVRSIAVIAALYGHNLHSARVRHEILSCLIPSESSQSGVSEGEEPMIAETARRVAKLTLKSAIRRVTGFQTAADCVELCQQLYSVYDVNRDDDGFVHIRQTPTHAARLYFQPRGFTAFPQITLLVLTIASAGPAIFSSPLRFLLLSLIALAAFATWRCSLRVRTQMRMLPQWAWTLAVFGVHAVLPLFSSHTAISMMLPLFHSLGDLPAWTMGRATLSASDSVHYFAMFILGLYNLSGLLIHHFDQLQPDERVRRLALATKMRMQRVCKPLFCWYLWMLYETLMEGTRGSLLAWIPYGAPTATLFWGSHSKVFILSWISVCAQQRLFNHLKNARELLFRLVGAEHVVASTLCLLLKGVAVIRSSSELTTFLSNIAPPPLACCCIMALRSSAVWYGIAFALCPLVHRGVSSPLLGVLFGSILSTAIWASFTTLVILEWIAQKDSIVNAPHRLAYLIPGEVSSRALSYLSQAFATCQRKAASFMMQKLVDRVFTWIAKRS